MPAVDPHTLTFWHAWELSFAPFKVVAPASLYVRVMEAWKAPHRKYHSDRHLRHCLSLLAAWTGDKPWPAKVALAIFFHDFTYDTLKHDNEERSARAALESLQAAGIPVGVAEHIAELVMATKHNAVPRDAEAKLLVDIDLAILGAAPARYAEYVTQVREEYSAVPDNLFYPARLKVMEGFVPEGRPLFHTKQGQDAFEAQARINLAGELEQLRARVNPPASLAA